MNKKWLIVITLICALELGCSPIEQQARNVAAALQGTILAAQAKYHDTCIANSTQTVCGAINKAIAGENAIVTAGELYCGWSTSAPPADPNAKCVPIKGAQAALNSAIANATALTLEMKGLL